MTEKTSDMTESHCSFKRRRQVIFLEMWPNKENG